MIAIIDIGSSSVRLLVAQTRQDGSMRVVAQDRAMTRLGDGLAAKGRLDKRAAEMSLEAIVSMADRARREGAGEVRAFATAAVREATNGREFVEKVGERAGLVVEVLDAAEEARLAFAAVASAMDVSARDAVVFDLGGGSLQVVQSHKGVIVSNASLKLGAVRMHRAFAGPNGLTPPRARALLRHADLTMSRGLEPGLPRPTLVVGVGGTATTLLAMAKANRGRSNGHGESAEVSLAELRGLIALVGRTAVADRHQIGGLPSDRADVILPGLIVVERLLTRLGATGVVVSQVGLREGLVLRTLREKEEAGHTELGPMSVGAVRQFASASEYDAAHSEHVAVLAVSLFDQMVKIAPFKKRGLGTDKRERVLLEAAAVAHDVGIAVEYRAHHKHGYAMISNADLQGWSREDRELVAVISRYHRRAEPAARHPEFARLGKESKRIVTRLAAILRVADGLDRTHTQEVRRVEIALSKKRLTISVDGVDGAKEDIKGSRRKAGLFKEVFGCELRYVRFAKEPEPDSGDAEADVAAVLPPRKRTKKPVATVR